MPGSAVMAGGGPCRVKICGITSVADGRAAAMLGADAIGLNFYPPSPRAIEPERAAEIAAALPPFLTKVALFVNPSQAEVETVLQTVAVSLLQFHGTESAGFCRGFGRPYIKTIGMQAGVDLAAAAAQFNDASALLLDAYDPVRWGGTGCSFEWSQAAVTLGKPIVLAGGLEPGNVAEAIRRVRPYAVDVCGGVEASPGVKDGQRLERFIRAVQGVER